MGRTVIHEGVHGELLLGTTMVINSSGDGDHIEHNTVADIVLAGSNVVIAHNNLTGIIVDAEFAAWQHEQISDNTAHSIQLHGVSNSVVAHNTVTGGGGGTCGSRFSSWLCNGIDVRGRSELSTWHRDRLSSERQRAPGEPRDSGQRRRDLCRGRLSHPVSAGARTPVIVSGPGAITTVLWHNTASHNGIDGIGNNAPSTLLFRNTANNNASLGINSASGATDLGGNRASHNGDPAQCVGVVCSP
jgi:hypothetical protein